MLKLMKFNSTSLLAALVLTTLAGNAHAQTVQFDPNNTNGSHLGGSGSFNTSSFWNGTTDAPFVSGDQANFDNLPGSVTVDAPVSVSGLEVNLYGGAGDETIGAPGTTNAITVAITPAYSNSITVYQVQGALTFNAPINLQLPASTVYGIYYGGGTNATSTTFNAINFTGPADSGYPGNWRMGTGNFTLNGAVTNATVGTGYDLGIDFQGGTTTLNSTASFSGVALQIDGSTVYSKTANLGADNISIGSGSFLTDAPGLTITNGIQSGGTYTVGSNTADDATFSGNFSSYNGATLNLTAAAGSTVHFTGGFYSTSDGTNGAINKIGTGTVSLESSVYGNGPTTAEPVEVTNGLLLLNNATPITGSTLTVDAVAPGNIGANQTYATLGGNGSTSMSVVALGGTSIIAPGNPGTTGTLGLLGGLDAANGVTLSFNLNGSLNSVLNLGAGALTLAGTTNVDFTSLGTVNVWTPGNANYYSLLAGSGSWTTSPTFDINAPAGYVVDHEIYNATSHTFEVDFKEVPEPSTYALMIGGLAFLAYAVRRKNRIV